MAYETQSLKESTNSAHGPVPSHDPSLHTCSVTTASRLPCGHFRLVGIMHPLSQGRASLPKGRPRTWQQRPPGEPNRTAACAPVRSGIRASAWAYLIVEPMAASASLTRFLLVVAAVVLWFRLRPSTGILLMLAGESDLNHGDGSMAATLAPIVVWPLLLEPVACLAVLVHHSPAFLISASISSTVSDNSRRR